MKQAQEILNEQKNKTPTYFVPYEIIKMGIRNGLYARQLDSIGQNRPINFSQALMLPTRSRPGWPQKLEYGLKNCQNIPFD